MLSDLSRKFIFTIAVLASSIFASNKINWQPFDTGLQTARAQKKYVFLDFYADWCQTCKKFSQTTLTNSLVKNELEKNFISIKVDTESRQNIQWNGNTISKQELSRQLQVDALPTMIYLNSEYEVIGSFSSYADYNLFMNLLTYISSGARSLGKSFEEYLKDK